LNGAKSVSIRERLKALLKSDLGFKADWLVVDFMLNNGLNASDLGLVSAASMQTLKRPTTICFPTAENK